MDSLSAYLIGEGVRYASGLASGMAITLFNIKERKKYYKQEDVEKRSFIKHSTFNRFILPIVPISGIVAEMILTGPENAFSIIGRNLLDYAAIAAGVYTIKLLTVYDD